MAHLELHQPSSITIGAFDGVHLGHQALIRQLLATAREAERPALVLTFDPLPRQVLGHGERTLLTTLEERLALIANLGVDGTVVMPFNEALINTPATTFVQQMRSHLALKELWIGRDFKLGKGQRGNATLLRQLGERYHFSVRVFEQVICWGGEPVRSSRIRRALTHGDMMEVAGCLGRAYSLTGRVVHGDQRGRTLGFPTANLSLPEERRLPANGVYVCRARVSAGGQAAPLTWDALANVGTRPTFDHQPPMVEVHLLNFSGDLYDRTLTVEFLHRLRPERRFASAAALVTQMEEDRRDARAWLRTPHPIPPPEPACEEARQS